MADVLRIKRRLSGAPGAPGTLANAEIAYNETDDTFWYGKGGTPSAAASIVKLGGTGSFLPLSGGTLTGPLYLAADPLSTMQAATKQYVDTNVNSHVATVTISDTAPASPTVGNLWWDSVGTRLYIYYNDGNSSQWVTVM